MRDGMRKLALGWALLIAGSAGYGNYRHQVIYVEACESGSLFEGLLPEGLDIYVTTASNAEESSWGTHCPGMSPPPPPEYDTCLGDLYSVAWMEDSEVHNLKEALLHQYNLIRDRTSNHNTYNEGSHVMQYGDTAINKEQLYLYMGFDPANANIGVTHVNGLSQFPEEKEAKPVNQRDADLLYLWQKYQRSEEDSLEKLDTQKQIVDLLAHCKHLDHSVELIGKLLFGSKRGPAISRAIRPAGKPLVDD